MLDFDLVIVIQLNFGFGFSFLLFWLVWCGQGSNEPKLGAKFSCVMSAQDLFLQHKDIFTDWIYLMACLSLRI